MINFDGKVSTDVLYTSLEIARDFKIVIRPYNVRSLSVDVNLKINDRKNIGGFSMT